jgi:hypothetical protein
VLAHCPQWWASQVSAGPSQKGIFLQLVEGRWGGHHHLQQQCNPVNFEQEIIFYVYSILLDRVCSVILYTWTNIFTDLVGSSGSFCSAIL